MYRDQSIFDRICDNHNHGGDPILHIGISQSMVNILLDEGIGFQHFLLEETWNGTVNHTGPGYC